MKKSFSLLKDAVISQGLCTRCGVCVGVCPAGALSLDAQNFPLLTGKCVSCGFCSECCPGADADLPALALAASGKEYVYDNPQALAENTYVAHAANEEVRQAGASGGVVTALLLFLLSAGRIDGAVVVGFDPERPYLTTSILASSEEEIRRASQSKYCVTPSMAVLRQIRSRKGKFAVTALPCQVHGLRKLAGVDPKLFAKIEVIFGLYCNSTMNPDGHLEALRVAGIRKEDVARFEFRGGDWPGGLVAHKKDGNIVRLHPIKVLRTVINVLFRLFAAKRCSLCIDGLSDLADLSFGDFWALDYSDEFSKLKRCTLVSQRTAKGLQILKEAEQAGAIVLHQLPADRFSKRMLSMVKEKRSKAAVYMSRRRRGNLPVPNYHVAIPEPGLTEWKKTFSYLLFDLFRGSRMQTGILKILFSPLIMPLHKLNRARLNLFARYYNN